MDFDFDEHQHRGSCSRPGARGRNCSTWLCAPGLRGDEVAAQEGHTFGKRDGKAFDVTPDGTVSNEGIKFLWDAEYKADWERGRRRISATDVYEANAFLEAAKVGHIGLLYPRLAWEGEPSACGEIEMFETVELDAGKIFGIAVEARGISRRGGFQRFSANLAAGVDKILGVATETAASGIAA